MLLSAENFQLRGEGETAGGAQRKRRLGSYDNRLYFLRGVINDRPELVTH